MRRTNIYLDDEQLRLLDELSAGRGISRAEVIRALLDRGLAGAGRSLDADLAGIEASFGALASEKLDVDRAGEDARARHLADLWAR